jgi:hypothetical protein
VVPAVRYVNTMEYMGVEKARRFVPLGQIQGVKVPDGFALTLLSDDKGYMLAADQA